MPAAVPAQGAAVLTGRIVDSAGAPIRGATVRIPQLERAAAADSAGQYRLEGLPTGRVTIVGEAPGFVGKRVEVTVPASGTVEQPFSLAPNAHLLANVAVRARARKQLPLKLHEFEMRQHSSSAGRFLGPEDLVKFSGRPLTDALKSIMVGARFQRNPQGEMNIVSARSLNPASIQQGQDPGSIEQRENIKPCGIQIWQDGALLSDPNQSLEVMLGLSGAESDRLAILQHDEGGADHDYDVSTCWRTLHGGRVLLRRLLHSARLPHRYAELRCARALDESAGRGVPAAGRPATERSAGNAAAMSRASYLARAAVMS